MGGSIPESSVTVKGSSPTSPDKDKKFMVRKKNDKKKKDKPKKRSGIFTFNRKSAAESDSDEHIAKEYNPADYDNEKNLQAKVEIEGKVPDIDIDVDNKTRHESEESDKDKKKSGRFGFGWKHNEEESEEIKKKKKSFKLDIDGSVDNKGISVTDETPGREVIVTNVTLEAKSPVTPSEKELTDKKTWSLSRSKKKKDDEKDNKKRGRFSFGFKHDAELDEEKKDKEKSA